MTCSDMGIPKQQTHTLLMIAYMLSRKTDLSPCTSACPQLASGSWLYIYTSITQSSMQSRPSPQTWYCAPLQYNVRKFWRRHHRLPDFYSQIYHWVKKSPETSERTKILNRDIKKIKVGVSCFHPPELYWALMIPLDLYNRSSLFSFQIGLVPSKSITVNLE